MYVTHDITGFFSVGQVLSRPYTHYTIKVLECFNSKRLTLGNIIRVIDSRLLRTRFLKGKAKKIATQNWGSYYAKSLLTIGLCFFISVVNLLKTKGTLLGYQHGGHK